MKPNTPLSQTLRTLAHYSDSKPEEADRDKIKHRLQTLEVRLQAMNIFDVPRIHDLQLQPQSEVLSCFEALLDRIIETGETNISLQRQIKSLRVDNKNIERQYLQLKERCYQDSHAIQEKLARSNEIVQEKTKELNRTRIEWDAERGSLNNNLKQLGAEIRKKDIQIKGMTEKAVSNSMKGSKIISPIEINGSLTRQISYRDDDIKELKSGIKETWKNLEQENQ